MSALDIAGAVLWTLLAACFWLTFAIELRIYGGWLASGKIRASIFTALAIYCVARIAGAQP